MTTPELNNICGGPVDGTTGVCGWCGYEHQATSPTHVDGETVYHYPVNCSAEWDRPRRSVNPRFRPMQPVEMMFQCWNCQTTTVMNSITSPELFQTIQQPDGVVYGTCQKCGVGLDIFKAKILEAR